MGHSFEHADASSRQDCLYRSYKELLHWIPSLKKDLSAESEDYTVKQIMAEVSVLIFANLRRLDIYLS